MPDANLAFTPAHELIKKIESKSISSLELVNYFYGRIEKVNPSLNAFLFVDKEAAKAEAAKLDRELVTESSRKLLPGIPSVVPDPLPMNNTPTTYGSAALKENIQHEDAVEIEAIKRAGSIILGKTNLAEFGLSHDTLNDLTGPCVNPWNPNYSAGGGAAGTAVAVASGMAPIGIGADFHGALRMSCGFCGVPGLMPTRWRVPVIHRHILPFTERKFYRKGVVARNIRDIALTLGVLTKPDPRDPFFVSERQENFSDYLNEPPKNLKIGWCADLGYMPVQKEVLSILSVGAQKLEALGHVVEKVDFQLDSDLLTYFSYLFSTDRYLLIMRQIEDNPRRFELLTEQVKQWLKVGNAVTGVQYSMAIMYLGMLEDKINKFLDCYDFLITPIAPCVPYLLGKSPEAVEGIPLKPLIGLSGFLFPFNMSGHPALSLPCGMSAQNLPVGMQVIGRHFSEGPLLAFAHQIEHHYPFPQASLIYG